MTAVLDIKGLRVGFPGGTEAVRGISLSVDSGEMHCLVGESGCGKSVTSLAVMGLLAKGAQRTAETISFNGTEIQDFSERQMRRLRGDQMSMIFQEPMTSLNPAYTVGSQMAEVYQRHRAGGRAQALDRAAMLLAKVGITAPAMRLRQYPHELSGGLRQRVMIAMALMCDPKLLIADEPTTALDVTVQAQILTLLKRLQKDIGLTVLLITHDLGVVARTADRVSVMYAGEIVESGPVANVFGQPQHPYTRGLIDCIPVPGKVRRDQQLTTIPGVVPRIGSSFVGCSFRDRCGYAVPACAAPLPEHHAAPEHRFLCVQRPGWAEGLAA